MGFRISWLAKQASKGSLLTELGFSDTGVPDEANEAPFSVAELPTGWAVVWSNDASWANIALCEPLGWRSPVVSCWVNETTMVSMINYFDGDDYWFVGHDAAYDRSIEGEVRPEFQDIVNRLSAEQAASEGSEPEAIDYMFDIPIEIAQRITGYRHDLWQFAWGSPFFTVVEPIATVPHAAKAARGFGDRLRAGGKL